MRGTLNKNFISFLTFFVFEVISSFFSSLVRSSSNKKQSHDKSEPINLPVLQPFPQTNTNYSVRRKRAKAMQLQNKRSNKELGVILAPK